MSRRLIQRVSRVVDRHASRRGFLRTSAMTATAMAVAPVAFAVRPTTAEAAIVTCLGLRCRSGDYCCDGWTEFCCRITGENTCPPGTVVAGWWKVDDSDFCSLDEPRPRYYIDCNVECDPSCRCGYGGTCHRSCTAARCRCPDGCGTRKSECLRFRYGQCNQDVCVGPISCRVVTCVPPWQWNEGCLTAPVLRSEATRWQDLPCLHESFNDIPPKAYYAEAVRWMGEEGIADGLKPDLFGPHKPVNRAQFSTFLWRYSGEPASAARLSGDASASLFFDDVPVGADYEEAVVWMAEQGITAGHRAREFGPDQPLTRVHAVVFLYRLAGSPPSSALSSGAPTLSSYAHSSPLLEAPASDQAPRGGVDAGADRPGSAATLLAASLRPLDGSDEHKWYTDALMWAVDRDIVWWYPEKPFDAEQPIDRALAAMLMHRYHLSRVIDSKREPADDLGAAQTTAGSGLSGSGLPGSGLSGSGLPGAGLSGSGLPGSGLSGSGLSGSGLPGSGLSGSGLSGSGLSGSGLSGSGLSGSGPSGSGL